MEALASKVGVTHQPSTIASKSDVTTAAPWRPPRRAVLFSRAVATPPTITHGLSIEAHPPFHIDKKDQIVHVDT
jgi:hypothetical protein